MKFKGKNYEGSAWVNGFFATNLVEITTDLAVLDSKGWWFVVLPFKGLPLCFKFANLEKTKFLEYPNWPGVSLESWTSSLDKATYIKTVDSIRTSISLGDVYQVNLCRVLSTDFDYMIPNAILGLGSILQRSNPAPYSACISVPGLVEISSASPELFLKRKGNKIISSPIKGTAANVLELKPKDRAENIMIVDLVRNDLGKVCDYGSVHVTDLCRLEQHPGLVHLVSDVEGNLKSGISWQEIIDASFPPGSVTGTPKEAALELIDALEPVERSIYCGGLGWVDADRQQGEINVAIRSFWIQDSKLYFGTGGAITWDSTPEGEWEETELKATRLINIAANNF